VTLTAIPLGPLQRQMLSAVMISPLCTKLEVGLQRLEYIASLRDPSKHVRRLLGTVAFGTSRTDPGGRVYPRPPRLVFRTGLGPIKIGFAVRLCNTSTIFSVPNVTRSVYRRHDICPPPDICPRIYTPGKCHPEDLSPDKCPKP